MKQNKLKETLQFYGKSLSEHDDPAVQVKYREAMNKAFNDLLDRADNFEISRETVSDDLFNLLSLSYNLNQ